MKKTKKYNIIIYSCLIVATILLVISGVKYLKGEKNQPIEEEPVKIDEPEEKIDRKNTPITEEPPALKGVDIEGVVKKYLDSILDQIQKKDKKITYKMIKTWGDYSIGEIEYQRKITAGYYEYKVDIIIPNQDAKLPCEKNEKLSTDEYIVISLFFDVADSDKVNGFIVKNVDIIEE